MLQSDDFRNMVSDSWAKGTSLFGSLCIPEKKIIQAYCPNKFVDWCLTGLLACQIVCQKQVVIEILCKELPKSLQENKKACNGCKRKLHFFGFMPEGEIGIHLEAQGWWGAELVGKNSDNERDVPAMSPTKDKKFHFSKHVLRTYNRLRLFQVQTDSFK